MSALAELETCLRVSERCAGALRRELDDTRQTQKTLAGLVREKTDEREACAALARQTDVLTPRIRALETQARQQGELRRCRQQIGGAQTRLERLGRERAQAEEIHGAAGARVAQLQSAQRAGRAALLAQTLAENQPCPVCGSFHHPQLTRVEVRPPSDAEVAAAEQAVEKSAGLLHKARNVETEEATALAALRSQAEGLAALLNAEADMTPEELAGRLAEACAQAQAAAKAAERLPAIEAALATGRGRQATLENVLPKLEADERLADTGARRLAAELTTLQRDIPEALRSSSALEAGIAREEEAFAAAQRRFNVTQDRVLQVEREVTAAAATLGERAAACEWAEGVARRAEEELAARLAEAGFADAAALRAARKAPEEILRMEGERGSSRGLRRRCNGWRRRGNASHGRRARWTG